MPGLTVGVLGQLEVSVDGRVVRLTTRRLRSLLAVLAVTAGRTVSMERLTAAVWADDPPSNPRRSLQTYAVRLRAELGDRVVTQTGGLALDVRAEDVDALRFEQLLDEAAGQATPEAERRLLDDALGMWRGEPFEGIASRWLEEVEAPRLVERRLSALERRIDLDLAAGRHGELVGDLNEWAVRYPLRESLWVRLLVTLDRCGRRADALERYEQIRRRVADELGVDPSPELRQVYADLLVDHPVTAGSTPAEEQQPTTPLTLPQQLPASPPAFTGRTAELAQFDNIADSSAVVITAIDGMAGVGKTALAVHAARQVAGRYPDGQLFLDLHGFTEGVAPVDATTPWTGCCVRSGFPVSRSPRNWTIAPGSIGAAWPTSRYSSCWTTLRPKRRWHRCCQVVPAAWSWSPAGAGWSAWTRRARSRWTYCRPPMPSACSPRLPAPTAALARRRKR